MEDLLLRFQAFLLRNNFYQGFKSLSRAQINSQHIFRTIPCLFNAYINICLKFHVSKIVDYSSLNYDKRTKLILSKTGTT